LYKDILGTDSRLVVYGYLGGVKCEDTTILGKLVAKRIAILGTNIRTRSVDYKEDVMQSFDKIAMPLFADGRLKPVVYKSLEMNLSVEEDVKFANEGHSIMENNQNTGKIIFEFKN